MLSLMKYWSPWLLSIRLLHSGAIMLTFTSSWSRRISRPRPKFHASHLKMSTIYEMIYKFGKYRVKQFTFFCFYTMNLQNWLIKNILPIFINYGIRLTVFVLKCLCLPNWVATDKCTTESRKKFLLFLHVHNVYFIGQYS